MKKKIAIVGLVVVMSAIASAFSLTDARNSIGAVISDPDQMTSVMKKLSPADQKAFVAEVNKAISEMPGSADARAAKFLSVNKAALRGSAKGNLTALVAEVFATVPMEVLVVINENFATTLFDRAGDRTSSYTDAQFANISKVLIDKVNERMAEADDGARRSTFAILMMVRASGGSPANLQENLIATLPADAQNEARNSWIPAAMGAKQTKSYEPLLGESMGETISARTVIQLSGPQYLESMLSDVVEMVPLIWTTNDPTVNGATPIGAADINSPSQPTEPIGYQGQKI